MTKSFRVHYTCRHCGMQSDAQTAFGRWMRDNRKFDSADPGIIRTDTDHFILRHKTPANGKEQQLLMLVEVKERGADPDEAQTDLLKMVHRLCTRRGKNMHGASTCTPIKVFSDFHKREVQVRFYGYHLLQFEKTGPLDSQWIKWDRKPIDIQTLEEIILFERHPMHITKHMGEFLRDRHAKPTQPQLSFNV